MIGWRSLSLGAKLTVALLCFLLVLAAASSAIIFYGFRRAQDDASERSQEALEEQGKLALEALVGGVAEAGGLQIEWAAELGQRASRYLQEYKAKEPPVAYDVSRFVRTEEGVWYDPDPARTSDVVVPNRVEQLTASHLDDIAYSAALDPLFPALVEDFPGALSGEGFRPIAIVFVGINGVGRYYPAIGIQGSTPADLDISDFYDRFGPVANPDRLTTWTPPYEDLVGRGLVMTAQTPIYEGDIFRGIFEVDLSIAGLVQEINGIQPTPGAFAFYVDGEGEIMRSDAFDLLSREAVANGELGSILEAMKAPSTDSRPTVAEATLDGRRYFIAYAPLPAAGGSIAAAVPIDEVTDRAAPITAGIEDEGTRTLQIMLVALGALFGACLAGATYLNRRLLVGPLRQLATATRQVAGGDLTANVPVQRSDELGALAADFNVMVEQLRASERVLEQRVEDRTRELNALLRADAQLHRSLDQDVVLDALIDAMIESLNVDKCVVSLRVPGSDEVTIRAARMLRPESIARINEIYKERQGRGEPVLVTELTVREDNSTAPFDVRAVLEVEGIQATLDAPIITPEGIVGGFGTAYTSPHTFTDEEVRLAQSIAERAGVAIHNAQLADDVQRRARETEALLRADAELFQTLSLDRVLQALVDVSVDLLGADKSSVVLHQGDVDVVRAARNYSQSTLDELNHLLAGIPHVEPDGRNAQAQVYESADAAPAHIAGVMRAENEASHATLPVAVGARMFGAFGVGYVERHQFTDDDMRVYRALADRAAVAIQNAELYERAQQAASLEERQRLARELHDSVSQALYGIALGTRTARLRLGDDPGNAGEPIDYVMSLAQAGLAEMRALIFELRPESLQEEGLVSAIEKQAASISARYGLKATMELGEEPECALDVKEAFYRIAQEALHNVVKHAQAESVNITLGREDGAQVLRVEDDGRGFDPSGSFPGHVGLHSMQERAAKLGGTVVIESATGHGARVVARVPE